MTQTPRQPLDLPISEILPALIAATELSPNLVVQAPPGAGKTTGVPLALLDTSWRGDGRIIVLEPRRLATRAAASRMAATLGEAVGETCGYRVRLDSRIGPRTRIEVVTDGLFTRLIQDDPSLDGIAAVLFDEFHERRLDSDLGLALCLDAQAALRPDLRLIAMSATLDAAPVAALMGDCPILTAAGRSYPVEIRHGDAAPPGKLALGVARQVRQALDAGPGDVLVFLPGAPEIRQSLRALRDAGLPPGTEVMPLHGDLDPAAQEQALRPGGPGCRKIVLSTSIAETSLTLPGIRHVVDAGLARTGRYDPRTGMTRLETVRVTQAGAEQRAGRAGRTAPGTCWRLWPEAQHRALERFNAPEMVQADLAPLLLELAQWGMPDAAGLRLLDAPNPAALKSARTLLADLGALDEEGRLTGHGKRMAGLGLHPRLAHMLLIAAEAGEAVLAAGIAAALSERFSSSSGRDTDLRVRLEALAQPGGDDAARRALDVARRLVRQLGERWTRLDPARAGPILALAYPDRIAERRGGPGRFRLSGGQGAWVPETDPFAAADYLAVAELDGQLPQSRIWLAAPLTQAELEAALEPRIRTVEEIVWDEGTRSVQARRRRMIGAVILSEVRLDDPPRAAVTQALLDGIRRRGIASLPWSPGALRLRQRIGFLAGIDGEAGGWPAMDDASLLSRIDTWLGPALEGSRSLADLDRVDLEALIRDTLAWEQRQKLDTAAPTHIVVPSGSRIAIDYGTDGMPVLPVKLQEMFGLAETPRIAGGRIALQLHLLSPAGRPIQVTSDLGGFWAGSYRAVRADLRGRYPKHPWPEDPLSATPTARAKPRGT